MFIITIHVSMVLHRDMQNRDMQNRDMQNRDMQNRDMQNRDMQNRDMQNRLLLLYKRAHVAYILTTIIMKEQSNL